MKKFLIRVSFFVIPLILFAFVGDWYFTHQLRKSEIGKYRVWNDLLTGKINSDIVIYGSSRAEVQFNTKIVEDSFGINVFNLGINGHNFFMEYLRHTLLLKHNKHPKLIILSLDNVTLEKRNELFEMQQFAPYLNDKDVVAATKTYVGFKKFDYLLPLVRYIPLNKIMNHAMGAPFTSTSSPEWYRGFSPHKEGWNNNLETAMNRKKKYFQNFDTNTIRLFDKFLVETKNQGIKLMFVYAPEYIEGQKFVANRQDVFTHFYFFSNKYKIPFFNYSSDSLCYDKKYFYDSQHLNAIGADIFTKKLVQQIRSVYIQ